MVGMSQHGRHAGADQVFCGLVMGLCNGFQILCEAALLPGALVRTQAR